MLSSRQIIVERGVSHTYFFKLLETSVQKKCVICHGYTTDPRQDRSINGSIFLSPYSITISITNLGNFVWYKIVSKYLIRLKCISLWQLHTGTLWTWWTVSLFILSSRKMVGLSALSTVSTVVTPMPINVHHVITWLKYIFLAHTFSFFIVKTWECYCNLV